MYRQIKSNKSIYKYLHMFMDVPDLVGSNVFLVAETHHCGLGLVASLRVGDETWVDNPIIRSNILPRVERILCRKIWVGMGGLYDWKELSMLKGLCDQLFQNCGHTFETP